MNSASKVYLLASLQVEPRDLELSMLLHGLVKFPSASFGGLENLTLRNVMVSTERFKNLRIILPNDEEFSQSLILHAPKLEWFSWAGCASNYSCEGNVEFLCHSDISIEHASIANNEYESLDNGIIGKVLQSMHRVSSMNIRDVSIKEISSPELLTEFCNLLSLTLKHTNALNEITSVVLLLKSMPQLNTLKILGIPYSKEEVEMEIEGKNNEIELIKYLLKNARALKKMTILYKALLCRESAIRKIKEFRIASSHVALYFRPV
ncbi:F-box/FBD/LRR-repeat protein At3g26920-like [Ziziphus jujuba]|uniref:F-box/FBD/LRR-repeat protein At3g26920-like n=1 Tax=Ziziphus jujuba TaxID=326968 RepID=A0ABM4A2P4_ZIZJJ|nr:F-box/FBD/LRR-repeat protein At3g26920-like [Ziziphus jujuba]